MPLLILSKVVQIWAPIFWNKDDEFFKAKKTQTTPMSFLKFQKRNVFVQITISLCSCSIFNVRSKSIVFGQANE